MLEDAGAESLALDVETHMDDVLQALPAVEKAARMSRQTQ
jgi:hypothetical protein